ncbi:MAG: hypothetical protein ACI4RT_07885 [Candidatus Spyradenecus sp.]
MLKYRFLIAVLPLSLLVGCSAKYNRQTLTELVIIGVVGAIALVVGSIVDFFKKFKK